jgi:hypothetical protein
MESEVIAIIAFCVLGGALAFLMMPVLLVRTVMDRKLRIAELNARANESAIRAELQPLREEMAQLRRDTNDLVLGFDVTLQRLEARLQKLEHQALSQPTSVPLPGVPASLPAGERRSWVESHVASEPRPVAGRQPP